MHGLDIWVTGDFQILKPYKRWTYCSRQNQTCAQGPVKLPFQSMRLEFCIAMKIILQ